MVGKHGRTIALVPNVMCMPWPGTLMFREERMKLVEVAPPGVVMGGRPGNTLMLVEIGIIHGDWLSITMIQIAGIFLPVLGLMRRIILSAMPRRISIVGVAMVPGRP